MKSRLTNSFSLFKWNFQICHHEKMKMHNILPIITVTPRVHLVEIKLSFMDMCKNVEMKLREYNYNVHCSTSH